LEKRGNLVAKVDLGFGKLRAYRSVVMTSLPAAESFVPLGGAESKTDSSRSNFGGPTESKDAARGEASGGGIDALLGMWATIFQQQIVPDLQAPEEGQLSWTQVGGESNSEAVQTTGPIAGLDTKPPQSTLGFVTSPAGMLGGVSSQATVTWQLAQNTPAAQEAIPRLETLPGLSPISAHNLAGSTAASLVEASPVLGSAIATAFQVDAANLEAVKEDEFQQDTLDQNPTHATTVNPNASQPLDPALHLSGVLPRLIQHVPAPFKEAAVQAEAKVEKTASQTPVLPLIQDLPLRQGTSMVVAANPEPVNTGFETQLNLKKKVGERLSLTPMSSEQEMRSGWLVTKPVKPMQEPLPDSKPGATAKMEASSPFAELAEQNASATELEAEPLQPSVAEQKTEAIAVPVASESALPVEATTAARQETPQLDVRNWLAPQKREATDAPAEPKPAVSRTKETPPPPPNPTPASREAKTISIRIPFNDGNGNGSTSSRHIDLVFNQRSNDLTLQVHSPNGEMHRRIEESMPSLMDKLHAEDWTAKPAETAAAKAGEISFDGKRRVDNFLPVGGQAELVREAISTQSTTQHGYSFDDSPANRKDAQDQNQQGRNRKKDEAWQAEFDEQLEP